MRFRVVPITLAIGYLAGCHAVGDDGVRWVGSRGSCSDDSESRPAPRRASTATQAWIDSDEQLARLTERVPGGFAGIFIENGTTVVMLTDLGQMEPARTALRGLPGLPLSVDGGTSFRQARWTFRDLKAWQDSLAVRSPIPELRSSGIDVVGNRIEIGAENEDGRHAILRRLGAMDIPCRLIAVKVVGVIRAM
jgi:hypothetical protein